MFESLDARTFASVAAIFLIVETVLLFVWLRRRQPGLAVSIVLNGLSGLCLMASVIALLAGGGLASFAVWLFAALVAHLADIAFRLRRAR